MDIDAITNAILMQESGGKGFNPAQIQPETWRAYAQPGEQIGNRNDNLAVMRRIIQDYATRYNGDPNRIAAAYFSGPGNVTPSNYPNAFFKDKSDKSGKTVSSYVADIGRRLGNMEEDIPDYLGKKAKGTVAPATAPTIQEEDIPDYLATRAKEIPTKKVIPKTVPIEEFGKGTAYQATHSLSNLLSTGGQAAQWEMGQQPTDATKPFGTDIPGTEETFKILQGNVTGQLSPGAGGWGQLGRNFGGTLPYMMTMPGLEGIIPRLVQSGLIGAGTTAGERATKGSALEPIGGLIGGVLAPTAIPYLTGKALQGGGNVLAGLSGGFSGLGSPGPVKKAFTSGAEAGTSGERFWGALNKKIAPEETANRAYTALDKMYAQKNADYQKNIAPISNDKRILDFKDMDKALNDAKKAATFGEIQDKEVGPIREKIAGIIDEFRNRDPSFYHTPMAFDFMKRQIGNIKNNIADKTSPPFKIASDLYNAARNTIAKQVPDYDKAMKAYSEAKDNIDEIRSTLSLTGKASIDTTFRKLLSTMRNNASTNYGQRLTLLHELEMQEPGLSAEIAGHSMQSMLPHGLARGVPAYELGGVALAAAMGHPEAIWALTSLPLQSPRIVGTAAHGLGRLYGKIAPQLSGTPMALAGLLQKSNKLPNTQIPYRGAAP